MNAVREKDQADFDLEKMFEMLDEALTSKDERVQNALRGLLTIIALTKTQDDGQNLVETSYGPLRRIQEDLKHITRRLSNIEGEVRQRGTMVPPANPWNPASQPYTNPGSPYQAPGTGYPAPYVGPTYSTTTTNPGDYGGVAAQSPQLWNQK